MSYSDMIEEETEGEEETSKIPTDGKDALNNEGLNFDDKTSKVPPLRKATTDDLKVFEDTTKSVPIPILHLD